MTDVRYVPFNERFRLERMSRSSWQAVARWGFKQEPNVPQVLEQIALAHPEINLDPMQTSYFLSRQTVIVVRKLPFHQAWRRRSEEHTSELQSLMRISSAVFCLKKKKH